MISDLKILEVLMSEKDYSFIMSLIGDKNISESSLMRIGAIVIMGRRAYC